MGLWRKRLPLLLLLAGVLAISFNFARSSPRPVMVSYLFGPLAPRVVELEARYLQGDPGHEGEVHRALFRYAEGRAPASQLHRFQLAGGQTQVRLRLKLAGDEVRNVRRAIEVPAPLLKLSGGDGPHEISLDLTAPSPGG